MFGRAARVFATWELSLAGRRPQQTVIEAIELRIDLLVCLPANTTSNFLISKCRTCSNIQSAFVHYQSQYTSYRPLGRSTTTSLNISIYYPQKQPPRSTPKLCHKTALLCFVPFLGDPSISISHPLHLPTRTLGQLHLRISSTRDFSIPRPTPSRH